MRNEPVDIAALKAARPLDSLVAGLVKLGPSRGGKRTGPCACKPNSAKAPLWVQGERWGCLRSGGGCGGDHFDWLRQFAGLDFGEAIAHLGGSNVAKILPRTPEQAAARAADSARAQAQDQEQRRARAWGIWQSGEPVAGSPVQDYLSYRGLGLPRNSRVLRYHSALPYYDDNGVKIYEGPAMLAAIQALDGRFIGVHRTWIDDRFSSGMPPLGKNGKAIIKLPDGSLGVTKRMLGLLRGGAIRLTESGAFCGHARIFVVGEGIETTLSVVHNLQDHGPDHTQFVGWAAGDLGNLVGSAARDAQGKSVPSMPDMARPGMLLPPYATHVLMLGDGDSDPVMTAAAIARGQARWREEGRIVEAIWPGRDRDFNDLLMMGDL